MAQWLPQVLVSVLKACYNIQNKYYKENYYLYTLEDSKRADIKALTKTLEVSKLSFACEKELNEILGLERGAVTPLLIQYLGNSYREV